MTIFLDLLLDYEKEKSSNVALSIEMEAAVELLSLLRKCNVSFQLYSKIVKWTMRFFPKVIPSKLPSCEGLLKSLSKRYHLNCLKPFKTNCVLLTTNLQFDVITHCFMSSMFSLLTDESLMQPKNLIFDNYKKPAAAFTKFPEGIYHEINSGSTYQDHVNNLPDPENTIVFPLIMFCDGMVVDGAHRKPLEPISFTFGIFCQHV